VWTEGDDVFGEAKVLNTRLGRDVAAILAGGAALAVSSRASGAWERKTMDDSHPSFSKNSKLQGSEFDEVTAMKLKTYDVVVDPGFADARFLAYENMRTVVETLNKRAMEDEEMDEAKVKELEQEAKELKEQNTGLQTDVEQKEAKVKELEDSVASLTSKVEETEKALPSEDQKKLLDRLAELDTEKLENLLQVLEGKVKEPTEEPSEVDRLRVAMEAKTAALEEKNKALEAKLLAAEQERENERNRALIREHVATAVAHYPEAARPGLVKHLEERCETTEQVDNELKHLEETFGLKDILTGVDENPKGEIKGKDVETVDTPRTESDLDVFAKMHRNMFENNGEKKMEVN
jgi:uncharacterized protein YoxC